MRSDGRKGKERWVIVWNDGETEDCCFWSVLDGNWIQGSVVLKSYLCNSRLDQSIMKDTH